LLPPLLLLLLLLPLLLLLLWTPPLLLLLLLLLLQPLLLLLSLLRLLLAPLSFHPLFSLLLLLFLSPCLAPPPLEKGGAPPGAVGQIWNCTTKHARGKFESSFFSAAKDDGAARCAPWRGLPQQPACHRPCPR